MKRLFLAAMLLLSLHLCASAQTDSTALDTIRDRYHHYYYYYSWYDTCPRFYDSTFHVDITLAVRYNQPSHHLVSVNITTHPIAATGLAALVLSTDISTEKQANR